MTTGNSTGTERCRRATHVVVFAVLLVAFAASANDEAENNKTENSKTDTRQGIAPDIREDETKLKVQRGNLVVVPIPISNPTIGSGLVAGGAYFYGQTEEQKKAQPASLTGLGGLYTNNDSKAIVAAQQNYWNNDRWRFTGAIGVANLKLSVLTSDDLDQASNIDWGVRGAFFFAKIATRIKGNWYGGLFSRFVNAEQSINLNIDEDEAELDIGDIKSAGLGLLIEYDSRDMPTNAYSGRYFKVDALFNDESIGSDRTYQSYSAAFQSYHQLTEGLVLAWEVKGCIRGDGTPLWDACTVGLRGFSATDYLGQTSATGQVEARWHFSKRWGLVGFVGRGYADDVFSGIRDSESIPSYGLGIRFMVLPAKRINIRVDFARSNDSDAVHVSVGEAF